MADLLGVKVLVLVCSSAITTKNGSPSHSELEGHDLHRVWCDRSLYLYIHKIMHSSMFVNYITVTLIYSTTYSLYIYLYIEDYASN